jgi:UDP-N-acetylglucosamine diphosphorylase / glucose-1-phosphate thymidylyltransferase / UDP-N-acetylgalactosamine diphosphorylase / glucosamine-1-phosphate N-acetyltransferase / galactosamine-1-phosphate N-acetyltransferase
VLEAVVMAAGEGTRLRPLTERWAKPVLPIDGRAVLSVLLRELAAARCERVWLVTGYLADQVEQLAGDGSAFGLEVRSVRQPGVLGSADAVRRALDAGAALPVLVSAADTVYQSGDPGNFAATFTGSGSAGAVAVRLDPPPGRGRHAVRWSDGRVARMRDDEPTNPWSSAPLWALGPAVAERLCLDQLPYELENAFQAAIDAGETVAAVEIGETRDLTYPLDLVEQNFPYLRSI